MKTLQSIILEKLRLNKETKVSMFSSFSSLDDFVKEHNIKINNDSKENTYVSLHLSDELLNKIFENFADDNLNDELTEFLKSNFEKDFDKYSIILKHSYKCNINYIIIREKNTTWPDLIRCQFSKGELGNMFFSWKDTYDWKDDEQEMLRLEILLLNIVDFIINYYGK